LTMHLFTESANFEKSLLSMIAMFYSCRRIRRI